MKRRMKISKGHIIAYALSAIILILISIKLYQHFTSPKVKAGAEILEQRDLDIVFGKPDAPLAIYMYSNYGCTYCKSFLTDVFPQLKEEFIDEGKVKLIMRLTVKTSNLDVKNSLKAAVCVNKYGYFEYLHELLLTDNSVIYSPEFKDMVDDFIEKDMLIAECILGSEAEEYLQQNLKDFDYLELKGTPSFIVGKTIYQGYRDYDEFKKIVKNQITHQ
ncbi:MAG: thioredoxin domain-containing protein [Perlabentimonas sp.]